MDWISQLATLDIIVLLIFAFFIGRGVWVGFIRQISALIALFAGYLAAGQLHSYLYPHIKSFLDSSHVAFLLTYGLLFAVIYFGTMLLGKGLQKVMDISLLVWFDRTMGGLLGAMKGLFLSCLIFMVLAAFLSSGSRFLKDAKLYSFLNKTSEILLTMVRDKELRNRFLPREPAIKPADILKVLPKVKDALVEKGEAMKEAIKDGTSSEPAAPDTAAPEEAEKE